MRSSRWLCRRCMRDPLRGGGCVDVVCTVPGWSLAQLLGRACSGAARLLEVHVSIDFGSKPALLAARAQRVIHRAAIISYGC